MDATPETTPERGEKVCKNCGYHDVSEEPGERCPACYFRHNSQLVHQAEVKDLKQVEVKKEAPAEDTPAEKAPDEQPQTQPEKEVTTFFASQENTAGKAVEEQA